MGRFGVGLGALLSAPPFDTDALRQASELRWPDDFRGQARLWAQNSSDLEAAADYIDELEAELSRLREQRDGEQA